MDAWPANISRRSRADLVQAELGDSSPTGESNPQASRQTGWRCYQAAGPFFCAGRFPSGLVHAISFGGPLRWGGLAWVAASARF